MGGYIKEKRTLMGWSQTRLAKEVGTSRAYISQIEGGNPAYLAPTSADDWQRRWDRPG